MADKLFVAIAAGGTAGHINPALALAEKLKQRGHRVVFVGQPTRLEAKLVPEAGFDFIPIRVSGFVRTRPWTLLSALWHIQRARCVLDTQFKHTAPDVCVGFGAYIELALVSWCKKHDVPLVLHEQNSIPGLANKISARVAKSLCVGMPCALDAFKDKIGSDTQVIVTGNPVRSSILTADKEHARTTHHIPQDAVLLVVFGGSLGAQHINDCMIARKKELLSRPNLYIIHSSGKADFDRTSQALALTEEEKKRWQLMPYINDMGEVLAAADFCVSRAGASSVAEIAALACPSILVPYPHATADHQRANASLLVDAHAAILCDDSDLDSTFFSDRLFELCDNASLRQELAAAAQGLGQAKAADKLAEQVVRAASS